MKQTISLIASVLASGLALADVPRQIVVPGTVGTVSVPAHKEHVLSGEENVFVRGDARWIVTESPKVVPTLDIDPTLLEKARGVSFFDVASIEPKSTDGLDLVIQRASFPNVRITVIGHADDTGPRKGKAKFNQRLSEERATAIRDWLVTQGVAGERISIEGRGDTEPLDQRNRAANRRVEVIASPAIVEGAM